MRYFWMKFEGNSNAGSVPGGDTLEEAMRNRPVARQGEAFLLTKDNGRRYETVLPAVAVFGEVQS